MDPASRHLALVGFMGAGKTTLGEEVARRIGRAFVDVDREVEREAGTSVAAIFAERGEPEFRALETRHAVRVLRERRPAVVALGGGAVTSREVREALAEQALTVLLDVDVDEAWRRVGGDRPLARDEHAFRALFQEREPLYREVADATAADAEGVVLAAAGIGVEPGSLERLGG